MKCIITGSCTITDHWLLEAAMASCPFADEITEVICGGAEGVDQLGDSWAFAPGITVEYFLVAEKGIIPMAVLRRLSNFRLKDDFLRDAPRQTWYENIHICRDSRSRNNAMVARADALVAVHDVRCADSRTPEMIALARAHGLRVHVLAIMT